MASAPGMRASSSRRNSNSLTDWLLRNPARSGRKVSGRISARSRWIATAWWTAANAASRRPRSDRKIDWLLSEVAQEGGGASLGKLPLDRDGFFDGVEGVLKPSQSRQRPGLVAQHQCEIRLELAWVGVNELSVG